MTSAAFEVGQQVLVAPTADDDPWRMTVDLVQDGQITLASYDDEPLPREWRELDEVHLMCLGRFSVYLIHVPVLRVGDTRILIAEPTVDTSVQRRAYARVSAPVPASYMLLDDETNEWLPFAGEVRDLGGGGCSILSDAEPEAGATLVVSFGIDSAGPLVVIGKVLERDALPTIGKPLTRIEFAVIRESDRDRILKFVLLTLAGRRKLQRQIANGTSSASPLR